MRIGITTPQRPKYNPSTKYPQQGRGQCFFYEYRENALSTFFSIQWYSYECCPTHR